VLRDDDVKRAAAVRQLEGEDDRLHRHAPVHIVQDEWARSGERGGELRIAEAEAEAVVATPVLGPEGVGREQAVAAFVDHADRRAGGAEEERQPLHEALGERFRVAGAEQKIALEVEELLDADPVQMIASSVPRRGLGKVIFLLPHGCGRM